MFKIFFLYELKYALKQPMVYIFLCLLALFTFGATVSDNIIIGGSVGNVFKNAPHVITMYTTIMTIFGLMIATAFYNNAALKDHNHGFNEILFSTPLSKSGYFFGRFFSALLISTIPMIGVFLGVIIGTYSSLAMGWVEPERFGSFHLITFINNYLIFILPNMFFAGAIIYSLANKWKSTVISFLGALVIIISYAVSQTFISDIDNETMGALMDTFGIRAYFVHSNYYTPIEKNTLSPTFSGVLLYNRLIWVSMGIIILLVSYFNFTFKSKNKKVKKIKEVIKAESKTFNLPKINTAFTTSTEWIQFKSFFFTNFLSIVKSVTFKILFLFSVIILISNMVGGFEMFGLKAYPVTYKMIDVINNAVGIFIIIILVFFSGELIWRDRDYKINEVIDSTPHTSFISLAAKSMSLISITVILHLFFILTAIIYQLVSGYSDIEIDVYLTDFFLTSFVTYIVWSGIMITIQVLVNHKYLGYFVSILIVFVLQIILSVFDVESNMLLINGGPSTDYSEIAGFGPGLLGSIWFNLYWLLFSLFSLIIAGAIWNRGTHSTLLDRIKNIKYSISRSYKILMIVSFILWSGVACFVYYNTQILNTYQTADEEEQFSYNYELKFKKYENMLKPKIIDAKYKIDIFPNQRDVFIVSDFIITNQNDKAIDSIHFMLQNDWETKINLPNAKLVYDNKEYNYQIYELTKPLQPNDTVVMNIETNYVSNGFENGMGNISILKNGTFLNNGTFLPTLGYNKGYELSGKNIRRKYGLDPKDKMPLLEKNCSDMCKVNYVTDGLSDLLNIETIISTSNDQIAIAPGSLLKEWKEGDRKYYHYKVDHPSHNFYSFMSGRFEVRTRKWNGIDLEVYYTKKHSVNVDIMLNAIENSLKYYTENFGPYYHKQCRIIEFSNYNSFAQAFPGTMPYSEGIGFILNLEDEKKNNIVEAVIAHEMAHQWWAHQVIGAEMQGATMLSESFSEYSALMTMKSLNDDPMKMRQFLKYDHRKYLRGRSADALHESPLYKVENQGHIHYGKGSVILYALQDYIGEDKVNQAMKGFLEEYRYKDAPFPTSLDFLDYLEPLIPDSLDYVINDWFKEITLYDNKLKSSTYKKISENNYEVTIDLEIRKYRADSIGTETIMALNDWVDIGVFSDDDEEDLKYIKRVRMDKEKMSFTFNIDFLPKRAGVDPQRLLIDRVYNDNIKSVEQID